MLCDDLNGKEILKREYMYNINDSLCCQQKLTQHCKATMKVKVLVTQACLAFYDPMDCSPPGSSVHEIFQARLPE